MPLADLKSAHPWPATRPYLAFDPHGWCQPEHRQHVGPYLGPDTRVILELGSWLGQSTRLLLELAPAATVIAVDTWMGSTDMIGNADAAPRLASGRLFDQFLANQWDYRDRLVPIRETSLLGMAAAYNAGVVPDLIFFDTEHTTDHLLEELRVASEFFPSARLYGDDWGWPSVQTAVVLHASQMRPPGRACGRGNAWVILRDGEAPR